MHHPHIVLTTVHTSLLSLYKEEEVYSHRRYKEEEEYKMWRDGNQDL